MQGQARSSGQHVSRTNRHGKTFSQKSEGDLQSSDRPRLSEQMNGVCSPCQTSGTPQVPSVSKAKGATLPCKGQRVRSSAFRDHSTSAPTAQLGHWSNRSHKYKERGRVWLCSWKRAVVAHPYSTTVTPNMDRIQTSLGVWKTVSGLSFMLFITEEEMN